MPFNAVLCPQTLTISDSVRGVGRTVWNWRLGSCVTAQYWKAGFFPHSAVLYCLSNSL